TCSPEHNIIFKANICKDGYVAFGVGAILCAQHVLVHKNGAGDLQLGEGYMICSTFCVTYANMDYIFFCTLIGVLLLMISYNIACQWSKKIQVTYQELSHLHATQLHKDVHAVW
ncbi:hypothetical protein C8Q80DRAFT_1113039, partial [Daedaleopsis nitida]